MTTKTKVLLCFHSMVTLSNHRLAEELSRFDDIELQILAPEWWPEEARFVRQEKNSDANYLIRQGKIWYWRKPHPSLFCYRQGLAQALRQFQPDIIDFYEEPFSLVMGQMLLLQKIYAPKAKFIFYSAQNIFKNYPPPFNWFEQLAFRQANAANVCNNEAGQVLQRKGYNGPLYNLPLGADPHVFKPMLPQERYQLLASLGLSSASPVIGYLGRLHWEKGLNVLLEAVATLDNTQLLLVGDGPHRAEIEQKITQLKLSKRVCLTGAINRLEVPTYLNCMDCLIVPSLTRPNWKEQFGRIIVEAFLCNLPVIASDCGSIPEIVGEAGVIVPEGEVRALATAIQQLLSDPSLAATLAKKAHARALEKFTWERVAMQRLQMYHDVLHKDN